MFRVVRLAARAALVAVPIVAVGGTGAVISINDEWDSVFPKQSPPVPEGAPKERIVILGTGWAALETLRKLDTSSADVSTAGSFDQPSFVIDALVPGHYRFPSTFLFLHTTARGRYCGHCGQIFYCGTYPSFLFQDQFRTRHLHSSYCRLS